MEASPKTVITVEATVHAPIAKAWKFWTAPEHIVNWNNASDDWHTPSAENDLRTGGRFVSKMAARDGSFEFDFGGKYTSVVEHKTIAYEIDGDGRKVSIDFTENGNETKIVERFEAEAENAEEMQKGGWQAILNNFKKYTETSEG